MNMSEASAVLGVIAVIISISIGIGTLRQRASEPTERRIKALEDWKKDTDSKLRNDFDEIKDMKKQSRNMAEFQRVTLLSVKGILAHLTKDNQDERLQGLDLEIEKFLIGLTGLDRN